MMKLDKRPDGPMLEGACQQYSRAVEADLRVDEIGILVEDKFVDDSGEIHVLKVKKNPAVEVSNGAWSLVRSFCSEFGLSPVSRTRLSIEKGHGASDAEILDELRGDRDPVQQGSERVQ